MSKKMKNLSLALLLIGIIIVGLFFTLDLKNADLSVPFMYGGDAPEKITQIKTVIDNGWLFNNPRLGAPFGWNRLDFPRFDSLNYGIIKLFQLFTANCFLIANLYYILSFILIALSALFVLKHFEISDRISLIGAIFYTFLPYHYYRGIAHLTNAAYFMTPLAIMVLLWLSTGSFLKDNKFSRKYLIISIIISILTSLQTPYNGVFMAVLVPSACLMGYFSTKNYRSIVFGGIVLISICGTFIIEQSPTIYYQKKHGMNESTANRAPEEAEIYSLRLSQLILPHDKHRIDSIANTKKKFNKTFLFINENGHSYLGIAGVIGFLFLLLIYPALSTKNEDDYCKNFKNILILRSLFVFTLIAFTFATFSGFNTLIAFFITEKIRATNRIYVYIAFFSIYAFCIILEIFHRKYFKNKLFSFCFLLLVVFIGLFDLTSPKLAPNHIRLKKRFDHDKNYFQLLETKMDYQGSVFQLPYMQYPESPVINFMPDYSHLIAYIHTSHIKFSNGSTKGRRGYYWSKNIEKSPPRKMVEHLRNFGFSAIYIDTWGYKDRAKKLISELSMITDKEPLISENKRYVTFFISDHKKTTVKAYQYRVGEDIDFSTKSDARKYQVLGWAEPEVWGTWTVGRDARLLLDIDSKQENNLLLVADLIPHIKKNHPEQIVEVYANSKKIGKWILRYGRSYNRIEKAIIPNKLIQEKNPLEIRFYIPKAISPAILSNNPRGDRRMLGLGFRQLCLRNTE